MSQLTYSFKTALINQTFEKMFESINFKLMMELNEIISEAASLQSFNVTKVSILYDFALYRHSQFNGKEFGDKVELDPSLHERMEAHVDKRISFENKMKSVKGYLQAALSRCTTVRDIELILVPEVNEYIDFHSLYSQLTEQNLDTYESTIAAQTVDSFQYIEQDRINKIKEIKLLDRLLT